MISLGVSYFGNRFISHARVDLKRISSVCDYIVHTVSETDLNYHKAAIAKLFSQSRQLGLEVWADPWGLGGVFGGESFSKFLLEHRDSWQVMSDGRIVPAACLNRPEWRSFMMEWVLNVRDMGAQVIFWDEPHFSFDFESEAQGIYSCVCSVCQSLFKKLYASSMPSRLTTQARQFRTNTIKNFVHDMMIFSRSKGLKNSLCLYAYKGIPEYDHMWQEVAGLDALDIFGCDPYWRWRGRREPAVHVKEFSRYVVETASAYGKKPQIWIQAMRLPAGSEPEIHKAIQVAADEGVTHLAAWSFDGGELLDPVLSERPQEVWQAVEDAYKHIRQKR